MPVNALNMVEIVVAHYNEPLDWLRHLPEDARVSIYSKGEPLRPPVPAFVVPLENVGREAGTYFYHILARYGSLSDVTVFLQANPFDHYPLWSLIEQIEGLTHSSPLGGFLPLSNHLAMDDRWGQPNHWQEALPVGEVYERIFQREAPNQYQFPAGACFAASAQAIRAKPWPWWREVYTMLETEYPEVYAWTCERLWPHLIQGRLTLSG